MKNIYFRAFIAGTSFLVILTPYIYMGVSTTLNPGGGFSYFNEVITIPIFFGLLNMLFISIRKYIPFKGLNKYWAFGAFHGIFFSFLGNFWLHVPEKLFLLTGWVQYLTIPIAIVLYSLIWRYIVSMSNRLVGIEK